MLKNNIFEKGAGGEFGVTIGFTGDDESRVVLIVQLSGVSFSVSVMKRVGG